MNQDKEKAQGLTTSALFFIHICFLLKDSLLTSTHSVHLLVSKLYHILQGCQYKVMMLTVVLYLFGVKST